MALAGMALASSMWAWLAGTSFLKLLQVIMILQKEPGDRRDLNQGTIPSRKKVCLEHIGQRSHETKAFMQSDEGNNALSSSKPQTILSGFEGGSHGFIIDIIC